MQPLALASSVLRSTTPWPRTSPRDLELSYAGPHHGLRDALRVTAALAGILVYIGLVAIAGR